MLAHLRDSSKRAPAKRHRVDMDVVKNDSATESDSALLSARSRYVECSTLHITTELDFYSYVRTLELVHSIRLYACRVRERKLASTPSQLRNEIPN